MEGVVWCASKFLAAIHMSILCSFRIAGRISDSRLCSPSDSPIFETRKMKGDKNSTCGKYFPGSQICLRLPQLRRAVSTNVDNTIGEITSQWRDLFSISSQRNLKWKFEELKRGIIRAHVGLSGRVLVSISYSYFLHFFEWFRVLKFCFEPLEAWISWTKIQGFSWKKTLWSAIQTRKLDSKATELPLKNISLPKKIASLSK